MAVIKLQHNEIADVLDILHQRGVEYAISYESDGAYVVYGTDDTIQQIGDILWASQVVDELGMVFGAELFEQVDFVGADKIEV